MSIYEKILDIWTDHCDGILSKEDGKIVVSFPGESYSYDSLADAARDELCNIREYIKELEK